MAHTARAPRHDGEDVSPTTERELRGWYSTGLAAEIYAVCGVGSFAPIVLEQLAREAGFLRSDRNIPCVRPIVESGTTALARSIRQRAEETGASDEAVQCVVRPFGREIATPSFALYTFSVAVFVQALALISFSPIADYGTYRKRLLLGFAFTGATSTMAIVLVLPRIYLLASVLTIVGVVSLGSTFVLLNSYLPLLASHHPAATDHHHSHPPYNDLAQPASSASAKTTPELALSTRVSSTGVGLGYVAAVSVQVLSILALVLMKKANFESESTPLRLIMLLVGCCWFLLTVPGAHWLRSRPGPSLKSVQTRTSRLLIGFRYVKFAWGSVWNTIRTAAKMRQTWLFLIAWFLLSDAIATVSGTAILFARTELLMDAIPIALLSITVTCSGIAGAFTWPRISGRTGLQTKQTIIACVLMMEIIPLYGLLGSIPLIKSWGVFGLQQMWEIYPLGVIHGFVMGGLSSYCRALYGEIVPPGSEAAFFALYAITDKGSSAVGPAIVGAIVDAVGTIRPAFGFLAVLVVLPIPLLYIIDVRKGRYDAMMLSKALKGASTEPVRMEDYDMDDEYDVVESPLQQEVDVGVGSSRLDEARAPVL